MDKRVEEGKLIVIVAGPNGAGKTTFFDHYLKLRYPQLPFHNADEIASQLCPEDPASVAVRAGREMLRRVDLCLAEGGGFVVETTLSGRGYARAIRAWQSVGYEVHLYFLSLPSVDYSLARVAARVLQGGHNIPESDIRRRFDKGTGNFYNLMRDLVDYWFLFDNSAQPPRLIDSGANDHGES